MATQLNVWLAQRTIIHLEGQLPSSLRLWTDLNGSFANPIATYHPYNDILDIDMSDYIRTYRNVTKIYLSETNDPGDYIEYNVSILGLINPEGVIIPSHAGNMIIVPPYKMIAPIGSALGRVAFELRTYPNDAWTISEFDSANELIGGGTAQVPSLKLDADTKSFVLSMTGDSIARTLSDMICDNQYAMVRWTSFTGAQRNHIFEVRKSTIASDDGYSLLDIYNEYRDIKGKEDGFTLHLEGLNAYDIWYYSDIITSSLVEVSLDGVNWTKIQVTTNNITIPDGNGTRGKLDITIKYKRYDAVDM